MIMGYSIVEGKEGWGKSNVGDWVRENVGRWEWDFAGTGLGE